MVRLRKWREAGLGEVDCGAEGEGDITVLFSKWNIRFIFVSIGECTVMYVLTYSQNRCEPLGHLFSRKTIQPWGIIHSIQTPYLFNHFEVYSNPAKVNNQASSCFNVSVASPPACGTSALPFTPHPAPVLNGLPLTKALTSAHHLASSRYPATCLSTAW